jgi:hypothetical protein
MTTVFRGAVASLMLAALAVGQTVDRACAADAPPRPPQILLVEDILYMTKLVAFAVLWLSLEHIRS